jgi:hypothetical protein
MKTPEALAKLFKAVENRHSGQAKRDPESRISIWIPAFAEMTTLIYANIYATFRLILGIFFFPS